VRLATEDLACHGHRGSPTHLCQYADAIEGIHAAFLTKEEEEEGAKDENQDCPPAPSPKTPAAVREYLASLVDDHAHRDLTQVQAAMSSADSWCAVPLMF